MVFLPLAAFLFREIRDLVRPKAVLSLFIWLAMSINVAAPVRAYFSSAPAEISEIRLETAASFETSNPPVPPPPPPVLEPPSTTLNVNGRSVAEGITNGNFSGDLSGWESGGTVALETVDGKSAARIGSNGESGGDFTANFLRRTVDNIFKNISFNFNFNSSDYPPYDSPGFQFKVNDRPLFEIHAADVNPDGQEGLHSTGWQNFSFDPSAFSESALDLSFYAGDSGANGATGNGDTYFPSYVYLREITTTKITVAPESGISLSATSGQTQDWTDFKEMTNYSGPFSLGESWDGLHKVNYYSFDPNLPPEPIKSQAVTLVNGLLAALTLVESSSTVDSVTLQWVANGGAVYDLRYSTDPITKESFDNATKVDPWPVARINGAETEYTVTGLTPDTTYYFAVKSADATGKYSEISNIVAMATLPVPGPKLGDVVINEVMWMGTTQSSSDEWLELRNLTGEEIDLAGWRIENGGTAGNAIDLSGSIAPGGYYLIAHYASNGSAISDVIAADLVWAGISLNNEGEQLTLKDSDGAVIDQTPSGMWPAGVHKDSSGFHQSMERNEIPGDGTDPVNWHTCVDSGCNSAVYWDSEGTNYGTPREANLSANDKTTLDYRTLATPSGEITTPGVKVASPEAVLATSSAILTLPETVGSESAQPAATESANEK